MLFDQTQNDPVLNPPHNPWVGTRGRKGQNLVRCFAIIDAPLEIGVSQNILKWCHPKIPPSFICFCMCEKGGKPWGKPPSMWKCLRVWTWNGWTATHTHTPYQPSNCEKGRLTYSAQKQTAGVVFISYRQWQPRTSCLVRRCPQTWEKWYENGNGKPPFKKLFKVLHPRMFRFKWGKTAFRSRMVAEFSRLVHVAVLKQFQAAIHAFQNGRNATGCRWCCGISKM